MPGEANAAHRSAGPVIHGPSLLTEEDVWLFRAGRHYRLQDRLGAHPLVVDGRNGTLFSVWAPNAARVAVIGDFNDWLPDAHPLAARWDGSGIWEGFVPGVGPGTVYRYRVVNGDWTGEKSDPFALRCEVPPGTASIVWSLDHRWGDAAWLRQRSGTDLRRRPVSIYEVHLASWRRHPDGRPLDYAELADALTDYVVEHGFTQVEFLPVMAHPFYGSWGYQVLGYFAPSGRLGSPEQFMGLIDRLHQAGIGVILDWVPAHFPDDPHGLARFDGTCLFEHQDPRRGRHPDWHTCVFNHGRHEVRAFLISSALFWLDAYHADGLRVDAVASMLYLDYSRRPGEWIPNPQGGREDLAAIGFLKELNRVAYLGRPGIETFAEESTAWPGVSRPTDAGGLGFGFKWNMGWMHDTLDYFGRDPIHRRWHHGRLTFAASYAWAENFVLPLSHDEVVHGKRALLTRMPGDDWQRLANLRLLLGWLYTFPGKKLLFMGGEFGQPSEWSHDASLDWHLLRSDEHRGVRQWVADLNLALSQQPGLHELDCAPKGFSWIDCADAQQSVISFLRRADSTTDLLLVVANFTPVPRTDYRVGVPRAGVWRELLNSDAAAYGGSGVGNLGSVRAEPRPLHGLPRSVSLTLPPLGLLVLRNAGRRRRQ